MSQGRISKGKGEGEEGTDGAGKQGGGGTQPHQKKTGFAGAARYAKRRITGQPRSSSVGKEQDKKHFSPPPVPSSPLTPPPPIAAQPQPRLSWEPWQKSPDPQQPIASALVATPPVDNIIVPPQEPLLPQETDDVELSSKLTRMELERDRYKRDIENKERQLKEYEEELITLRTQLSKSRGGGGIQLLVDQQKQVAEYEATIEQLKDEKGELERGKEEESARQKKLEKEMEEHTKQLEEDKQQLEAELAGAKEELQSTKEKHKQEKRKYEDQVKELDAEMNKKLEEYQQQAAVTIKHHKAEAVAKAEDKLDKEKEALLKQVEELKNESKLKAQQIEGLETQREEQEEVIKAQVEKRVREEVDQHIRDAVRNNNQSAIKQVEEHKRAAAAHLKEREEELERHYEGILATKEKELEETKKQLQQKEEDERVVRDEFEKLYEKVEAGDGASANNSLSEEEKMRGELADQAERVKDLEEHVAKIESDKRELQKQLIEVDGKWREVKFQLQDKDKEIHELKGNLTEMDGKWRAKMTIQLQDKDLEIQRITDEAVYYKEQMKKTQNDESAKLRKSLEMIEKQELKKRLNELVNKVNDKVKHLQQKEIKIKHLEEQLSEKEKYIFDMEASIAADQKERERLSNEMEDKEKESDKNIADATQRIDELERQQQEQLKELKEENEQLRIIVLEQEKLTRELNEKDAKLKEQHIKVTKLEEEMERIRIEEGERQVELNTQRRELERKMDKLTSELQEKFKARYSDRLKEWQAKFNEVDSENKKLKDELNETEAKRLFLEDTLQESKNQFLRLKNQLQDKEQHCTILKDSLAVKSKTAIDLEKQIEELIKQSKEKEKKINLKAAELIDLQGKCGLLKQELEEKEQILVEAQMTFHNFQQSHSIVEHDLEVSQKRITTLLKKEAELLETIKSLTDEKKKMDKQLKETKQLETNRMKEMEEEVQVLTAQVNAYSRECEKQKGLVAQNQERHKTEIQVLNEKLTNEQKSKQRLESQLITMKQQYDSVSASKESLQQSNQQMANEWTMLREQFDNLTASNNSLCANNERLQQSKQQLESQLTLLRQQFDSLTASRESLLTAYNQEQEMVTDLEQHFQRTREDNEELKTANEQLSNELAVARQRYDSVCASEMKLLEEYDHHVQEIERLSKENDAIQRLLEETSSQLLSKQEEVVFLHKILSEFQSCWKFNREDVILSEQELGRGAWGVVLEGQLRHELRLKVAVKQLHQRIKSPTNLEMFHREINTMSQICHPNILHFFGAVLDHPSGCHLIITEVMDTSLRKAYESKELTPDRFCRPVILSIVRDVAVALNYLHCLPDPIIHRDVSSANVLLESIVGPRKWRAKISDFGSAKLAQFAVTKGPGAPAYSAPEACLSGMSRGSKKKQTPKMDVFSYGVLLCEAITCWFPDSEEVCEAMLRQVYSISDIPRGSRSTQGHLLHALIDSCRDDDPLKRPTMNEVIKQLGIIAM